MKLLLLLILALPAEDLIQDLQHKDREVRLASVKLIRAKKMTDGIQPLIELLKDEKDSEVRAAAAEALQTITWQSFGESNAEWGRWWTENEKQYRPSEQIVRMDVSDLERRVDKARTDIRWVTSFATLGIVLFLLVMIYWVAHLSSRMKAWKELVARAEVYVQKSEELTKRTDQIVAELDAKKVEIMAFVGKVREESQGELERFSDMLQKNFEHRMREEMMALRQKAEKELEQTLSEMRARVETQLRRSAAEQK